MSLCCGLYWVIEFALRKSNMMIAACRPANGAGPHVVARATSPDIDFSNVDSPAKAALLPSINAATFQFMSKEIAKAVRIGQPFSQSLHGTFGQSTPIDLTYQSTDDQSVAVEGTVGGQNLTETWRMDEHGLTIDGTIGSGCKEHLVVTRQTDGRHVDGTVGTLELHEIIDGLGENVNGTIGGERIKQTVTTQGMDGYIATHVEGSLGSSAIKYDDRLADTDDGFTLTGNGVIAGTRFEMTQTMAYFKPTEP